MEKPNYFRRCHVCGAVCQKEGHGKIERCNSCNKHFARFQYFDDRFTLIYSDRTIRPLQVTGEWIPIQGLTVYWESF